MSSVSPPPSESNNSNGKHVDTNHSSRHDRVDRPSFRKDRPAPYSRGMKNLGPRPTNNTKLPPYNRVFVQNIPYEEKWQNIKDLFRDKVGEVTYVEMFTDDSGKSRGYGIVEFKTKELCKEAVQKMNRYEIGNRKILVKLDFEGEQCRKALLRDGHPAVMGLPSPITAGLPPPMPGPLGSLPPMPPPMGVGPSMGIIPAGGDVLPPLNHGGPIGNTIFVANLDYKVTYSKLKEVFQLAGPVVKVDLLLDKDNKSRGMATISYENPMDAAQAISMLNNQKLFDRTMIVKMDKDNIKDRNSRNELPEGLSGIGPALNIRPRDSGRGFPNMSPPRIGGYGDSDNAFGPRRNSSMNLNSLADLTDIGKPDKLAASIAALNRLSESMHSAGPELGSLSALSGLSELARLGLPRNERFEERLLDERIRMLSNPGSAFSDRERIERDIQRVDSRIRDIDRSLERGRDLSMGKDLPPMPPPMNAANRTPGTVVFVKNLPYSLSWQGLRDKFSRCGRVMFAEVKTENGKSRGIGTVRFETPEQADAAIRHLDGVDIDGRRIVVHLDKKN